MHPANNITISRLFFLNLHFLFITAFSTLPFHSKHFKLRNILQSNLLNDSLIHAIFTSSIALLTHYLS